MEHKSTRGWTFGILLALALLMVSSLGSSAGPTASLAQRPQPEAGPYSYAFTYQGQLKDAGGPALATDAD